MKDLEVIAQTARKVYREVYEKFYFQEHDECQRILRSLRRTKTVPRQQPWTDAGSRSGHREMALDKQETCTILTYQWSDDAHVGATEHTVGLTKANSNYNKLKGVPRFSHCSPINRTMARDMGVGALVFIPFADANEFPIGKCLKDCSSLDWIDNFNDSDLELLEYLVALQLHFEHHFQYEQINATEVLSLLLRKGNKSGLLWACNQRDLGCKAFTAADGVPERNLHSYAADRPDLFQEVNRGLAQFCPNLNCLYHFCSIHTNPIVTPPFEPASPTPNDSYTLELVRPGFDTSQACECNCFRNHIEEGNWMENLPPLSDKDPKYKAIQSILKLDPDVSPCNLAVICQVECLSVCQWKYSLDVVPFLIAAEALAIILQAYECRIRICKDAYPKYSPEEAEEAIMAHSRRRYEGE
ncbi:hypothetical protein PQX77_003935 [Marasmius sp. AFHP31]|nr:hypothetical protein PQX77_003935 [Marasmius sp. AFHP31]